MTDSPSFAHPITPSPSSPDEKPRTSEVVVCKIWRKERFASFSVWPEAAKAIIDIGQFGSGDGKLKSSTKCYLDIMDLYAYLHADVNGMLDRFYPAFDKDGFVEYGGKGAVSRVFKIHWWSQPKSGTDEWFTDKNSRSIKCGHFEGKQQAGGAIMPIMTKPISVDSIKLSQKELLDVYLAYQNYINNHLVVGQS